MVNTIITQRHSLNKHRQWVDSLENSYISYFENRDFTLFPISNITNYLDKLFSNTQPKGIILTGGGEVDPELYGEKTKKGMIISKKRDALEYKLIQKAIDLHIPLLGICRGMQLINVFFGGKLIHINEIDSDSLHPCPGIHAVNILDKKVIKGTNCSQIKVNSYHNLGIQREYLGEKLIPFAIFSQLNLIEGFYHQKYDITAIQWHPERQKGNKIDEFVINQFLQKAKLLI